MIHPITMIVSGLVSASALAAHPLPPEPPTPHDSFLGMPSEPIHLGAPHEDMLPHPPHGAGLGGPEMDGGPEHRGMGSRDERPRGRHVGMLRRAIGALDGPDVPDELRLTPGQSEALKVLRDEMRAKFEAGERPIGGERPFAMVKKLLTPEQREFIKSHVRGEAADAREGRRGARGMRGQGRGMGLRAQISPEQCETMKMFRELSPEAKRRVQELIKQEHELQQSP